MDMIKYGILFFSLLITGLGLAGGIEQDRPYIAIPCLIGLAIGSLITIAVARRDNA